MHILWQMQRKHTASEGCPQKSTLVSEKRFLELWFNHLRSLKRSKILKGQDQCFDSFVRSHLFQDAPSPLKTKRGMDGGRTVMGADWNGSQLMGTICWSGAGWWNLNDREWHLPRGFSLKGTQAVVTLWKSHRHRNWHQLTGRERQKKKLCLMFQIDYLIFNPASLIVSSFTWLYLKLKTA